MTGLSRRHVLTGLVVGLLPPLFVGCGREHQPEQDEGGCVNLDSHVFASPDVPEGDDVVLLDWAGPAVVVGQSAHCWYRDGLLRFDLDTGEPTALLALSTDDRRGFAVVGDHVVCDVRGTLVIHRDGCALTSIPGSSVATDRLGLVGLDSGVVSLGADGSVDKWSVPDATAIASVRLEVSDTATLAADPTGEVLVVGDRATGSVHVLDPDLRVRAMWPGIGTTDERGWSCTTTFAVGLAGSASDQLLFVDLATGVGNTRQLARAARAVAAVGDRVVVADGRQYHVLSTNGETISSETTHFSPQWLTCIPGELGVVGVDPADGVVASHLATGRSQRMRRPS